MANGVFFGENFSQLATKKFKNPMQLIPKGFL
jgi:hypothetical protein